MTDIFLEILIIIVLLKIHSTEKNSGWYGHLYAIIKKRLIRRLYRYITAKIKEVNYGNG